MPRKPVPAEKRKREARGRKTSPVSKRRVPVPIVVAGRDVPVTPPADLPKEAKSVWAEVVQLLAEAGIIDRVDLPILRQFCIQFARVELSRSAIAAVGKEFGRGDLAKRLKAYETLIGKKKTSLEKLQNAGVDVSADELRDLMKTETMFSNLRAFSAMNDAAPGMFALGSTGQIVENPAVAIERAAVVVALRIAEHYALTPVARSRLAIAGTVGKKLRNELEDDLGAGVKRKRDSDSADEIVVE